MDRIAQRRGKLQKLKENLNLGGKLMEHTSPEFAELMEVLRNVDDKVREIAAPEGDQENALKDLLKVAKTNFNRREYMTAISFLGKFHDKLEPIDQELSKLENSVDMKHYEFLFGEMEPEHLDYLTKGLGEKFEKYRKTPTGIMTRASLSSEAGIADWWSNMTSDRGKALSAWEQRFPRYVKELKNQTGAMINKSETLLNFILASLKEMANFRAGRKLEDYLKTAKKLQGKFKGYNIAFISFYNTYVKKFLDYQKSIAEMPADEESPNTEKTIPISTRITPDGELPKHSVLPPTAIPSELVNRDPMNFPAPERITEEDPETKENATFFDQKMLSPKAVSVLNEHPSIQDMNPHPSIQDVSPDTEQDVIPETQDRTRDTLINLFPGNNEDTQLSPGTPGKKKAFPIDHSLFLQTIAEMENEHPIILAKEIITYAKAIEKMDIEMSQKLSKMAKTILGA